MDGKREACLAALANLSVTERRVLDDTAAQISARYQSGRTLLVSLGALAILIGAGFALAITRSITGPIGAAVQVAEAVSRGDLTSAIRVDSFDETGKLMSALKTMNDNLVDITTTTTAAPAWPHGDDWRGASAAQAGRHRQGQVGRVLSSSSPSNGNDFTRSRGRMQGRTKGRT